MKSCDFLNLNYEFNESHNTTVASYKQSFSCLTISVSAIILVLIIATKYKRVIKKSSYLKN